MVRTAVVHTMVHWFCATLLVASSWAQAATVPVHTVRGTLDSRARMEAVHAEMRRVCGVNPTSARCHRLKREFRQQAKACEKQTAHK
jgi:hypothetical protein